MTTYAEFQSYVIRTVWRTGDQDLTSDLPMLIKAAEARINRDIADITLETTATETAVDGNNVFDLPSDYKAMKSVTPIVLSTGIVPLPPLNAADIQAGAPGWAINAGKLIVRVPEGGAGDLNYNYIMKLVPYSDDPADPFYDKQPDFYMAAVLMQVFPYLREYELLPAYTQTYGAVLVSMENDYMRSLNATEQVRPVGFGGNHL